MIGAVRAYAMRKCGICLGRVGFKGRDWLEQVPRLRGTAARAPVIRTRGIGSALDRVAGRGSLPLF